MHKPEPHTIVRFKLRSLLAITFGVALVMTVMGPYLREMPSEKQRLLLYAVIAATSGMACSGALSIRSRLRLGKKSGRLLLNLEISSHQKRNWLRWLWLLILVPLSVFFFYAYIGKALTRQHSMLSSLPNLIVPFLVSVWITRFGLAVWADGYADSIDLCERGIVNGEEFRDWSDASMRSIHWNMAEDEIVININRHVTTVVVPSYQREAVEAILEAYYRPHHRKATD